MMGRKQKRKAGGLLLIMLALLCVWLPHKHVKAAEIGLVVLEIDYEKETMTVQSMSNDTKLFYSDGKQKTWECAYGQFGPVVRNVNGSAVTVPNAYVLDISWVSKTKNYTLSLKGDISEKVVQVVLPKQQTNFKAAFDYTKETFTYTNQENREVYWRKNNSTVWNQVDNAMPSTMKYFYSRGVTLYFRLGQVKGTGAENPGLRPSKEVKLTVSKQATAPSVTIAASSKTLNLSGLLQYQKDPGAAQAAWETASSKKLDITSIASEAYSQKRDVSLVFRTAATAKKPASMEKEITIKAQETAPRNVSIKIASPNSLSLQVEELKDSEGNTLMAAASASNPYEYVILKEGSGEPTSSTAWTSITKGGAILISSEKAPQGSKIYVRKQAHVQDKTSFAPESEWCYFVVGVYRQASKVALNGNPTTSAYKEEITKDGETKTVIHLVKEEGVGNDENSENPQSGLTFKILPGEAEKETGDSANAGDGTVTGTTDIEVKAIECGGTALEFTAVKEEGGTAVIVTITSTAKYEAAVAARNEPANVIITLSNGEVLNDSVTLKVFGGASVLQETLVQVIIDASQMTYEFAVVPGRRMTSEIDQYLETEIASLTVLNQSINLANRISKDSAGNWKVSLQPSDLTGFCASARQGEKYKAVIRMSNGQEITTGLEFCLTNEATLVDGPIHYSKSIAEEFTPNVEFRMSYKTPGISIMGITLENGASAIDIMGNCYVDKDYIHAVVSNRKINALTQDVVSAGNIYQVVVTLSNGVKVSTGYTFTFRQ